MGSVCPLWENSRENASVPATYAFGLLVTRSTGSQPTELLACGGVGGWTAVVSLTVSDAPDGRRPPT